MAKKQSPKTTMKKVTSKKLNKTPTAKKKTTTTKTKPKSTKTSDPALTQVYKSPQAIYRQSANVEGAIEILQIETTALYEVDGYAAKICIALFDGKTPLAALKELGIADDPRALKKTKELLKELLKLKVFA